MIKNENRQNGLDMLEESVRSKLTREFPALYYDKLTMVDPRLTRLTIDDVSAQTNETIFEELEYLMLACKGEVQVFDAAKLSAALTIKLTRLLDATRGKRTALIFPGKGAQVVKSLLPNEVLDRAILIDIPAERRVNTRTKAVEGVSVSNVTQARKTLSESRVEEIIVVDDVITTGATLTTLRDVLPGRKIGWDAVALLSLSPLQRRGSVKKSQSGIEGFECIISPIVYQGTSGIPALNSLSTLVGTSEKSQRVRSRYIEEFVEDTDIFMDAVVTIQQKITV